MSENIDEIIKAKDIVINSLLAEIQILKAQLQSQTVIDETLDNLEVKFDDNEITETIEFNPLDLEDEDEEQEQPNIMNILNLLMGKPEKKESNPFIDIMQQLMTSMGQESVQESVQDQ